jgi:hypothetical protein
MCLPSLAAIWGIHIQTHRLMGGICEVYPWDGLRCYDICTKFHKDWFIHWKVGKGRYTDTQTARCPQKSYFYFFQNKESKLKNWLGFEPMHVTAKLTCFWCWFFKRSIFSNYHLLYDLSFSRNWMKHTARGGKSDCYTYGISNSEDIQTINSLFLTKHLIPTMKEQTFLLAEINKPSAQIRRS